ncbi:acyl-ACP--UDP-N-acetylglucosamine O-acyltransferase [Ancylobacter sp. IITR112]|uniref:acyl-ACP--UDP-N-acetylglucosamine O-acyltransferase n=1 Tax=Ancylobacter sp. IITR112 TaxID=3138073 RepID=UPI00352BB9CF
MSVSPGKIDPLARVEEGAVLGAGVEIGPFCVVGPQVVLGDGVKLISHVAVSGRTTIGEGTTVYPFASLGFPPQSLGYKGEASRLVIGRNCLIREHVTMNTGTAAGHMETVVGDNCFFMVNAHVAHDCIVGNHVIFANNATLAGHVSVGNNVFLGGQAAVHQFVRIGDNAIVGGLCGLQHDLIPFGALIYGRSGLGGLNIIGMKRRGFSRPQIHALRAAYRELFYAGGTLSERAARVAEAYADDANVMQVVDFVRSGAKRRLIVPSDAADHVAEPDAA